jgi:hypothetical protein
MSSYDRMLKTNLAEFEREVVKTVARKFERVLEVLRTGEDVKVPVIDDEFPPERYRTPEYFTELQAKVVRALVCRKWFQYEAPAWAWPLPITAEDCYARCNTPGEPPYGRNFLVGKYGLELRSAEWDLERAPRFEVFCANQLRPPGFW